MTEQLYNDRFLARWLKGSLSKEELHQFNHDPEYKKYLSISKSSNFVKFPEFKIDANFEIIWKKIQVENALKRKHKLRNWSCALIASLVLSLGRTAFFRTTTTHTTAMAEQTEFGLPDNSKVCLSAGSKISYNLRNWHKNSLLTLDGEAYFEVEKGAILTVKTPHGAATVSGTRFALYSRSNEYHIICYEGMVTAKLANHKTIVITQGETFTLSGQLNSDENTEKRS